MLPVRLLVCVVGGGLIFCGRLQLLFLLFCCFACFTILCWFIRALGSL